MANMTLGSFSLKHDNFSTNVDKQIPFTNFLTICFLLARCHIFLTIPNVFILDLLCVHSLSRYLLVPASMNCLCFLCTNINCDRSAAAARPMVVLPIKVDHHHTRRFSLACLTLWLSLITFSSVPTVLQSRRRNLCIK